MSKVKVLLPAILGLAIVSVLPSSTDAAIVLGSANTFQNGTTEGWQHGVTTSFSPTNVLNAGPGGLGDNALSFGSSGGNGPGSRFISYSTSAFWTGNYTAAGVTAISLDIDNTGASNLNMRIALQGAGGSFVTPAMFVSSAPAEGWQTLVFPIEAVNLIGVSGATNAALTLSTVNRIELLSVAGTPVLGGGGLVIGDEISASALFDNIAAIPEPASASVLLVTVIGLLSRRRSRTRA